MLIGILYAPVGLIIPALVRYLIVKKTIPTAAAGIITFLNLAAVITIGILILRSLDMSNSASGVSIGGAISAILAFKMLTDS